MRWSLSSATAVAVVDAPARRGHRADPHRPVSHRHVLLSTPSPQATSRFHHQRTTEQDRQGQVEAEVRPSICPGSGSPAPGLWLLKRSRGSDSKKLCCAKGGPRCPGRVHPSNFCHFTTQGPARTSSRRSTSRDQVHAGACAPAAVTGLNPPTKHSAQGPQPPRPGRTT